MSSISGVVDVEDLVLFHCGEKSPELNQTTIQKHFKGTSNVMCNIETGIEGIILLMLVNAAGYHMFLVTSKFVDSTKLSKWPLIFQFYSNSAIYNTAQNARKFLLHGKPPEDEHFFSFQEINSNQAVRLLGLISSASYHPEATVQLSVGPCISLRGDLRVFLNNSIDGLSLEELISVYKPSELLKVENFCCASSFPADGFYCVVDKETNNQLLPRYPHKTIANYNIIRWERVSEQITTSPSYSKIQKLFNDVRSIADQSNEKESHLAILNHLLKPCDIKILGENDDSVVNTFNSIKSRTSFEEAIDRFNKCVDVWASIKEKSESNQDLFNLIQFQMACAFSEIEGRKALSRIIDSAKILHETQCHEPLELADIISLVADEAKEDKPGNKSLPAKRSAADAGHGEEHEERSGQKIVTDLKLDSFSEFFSAVEEHKAQIHEALASGGSFLFHSLSTEIWNDASIQPMMGSIRDFLGRVFFDIKEHRPQNFSIKKRLRADSHAYFVYVTHYGQTEPLYCATWYRTCFSKRTVKVGIEMKKCGTMYLSRLT